jgi:hypothetical protein
LVIPDEREVEHDPVVIPLEVALQDAHGAAALSRGQIDLGENLR